MREDVPLATVTRGPLVESVHRGRFVFCDPSGEVLEAVGDPEVPVYPRSSAKPFQALPLLVSGAADRFGLGEEEIAVVCSSHSGEEAHVEAVRSVLRKAGLGEEDLGNGAHPPLYGPAAEALARSRERPRPVHGNCSGKHAGMLALCVHRGWDVAGYKELEHPVQRGVRAVLARVCGVPEGDLSPARDNCGVQTFALPLRALATGFARLATGEGLCGGIAEAARRVREAMMHNPYLVAGTGRFDTDLMRGAPLVAKSGAEGVFACGSPEGGWGFALKVSDGAKRAVGPAAAGALARRGVGVPPGLLSAPVHDLHGGVVGEVRPAFGDRGSGFGRSGAW
ncbi:asparaginase [Rubrobacter naiadicus]|uniref:asparaginase n=1 Tax=Rubrobacter naiadicus TaxID=1392641 RepID=UPI0023615754|nr:asparaginase [Rubrobacter naiadicus]